MKSDLKKRAVLIVIICAVILTAMILILSTGGSRIAEEKDDDFAQILVAKDLEGQTKAEEMISRIQNTNALDDEDRQYIIQSYDLVSEKVLNIENEPQKNIPEIMYNSAFLFYLFDGIKASGDSDLAEADLYRISNSIHNYVVDYTCMPKDPDSNAFGDMRTQTEEIRELLAKIEDGDELNRFLNARE